MMIMVCPSLVRYQFLGPGRRVETRRLDSGGELSEEPFGGAVHPRVAVVEEPVADQRHGQASLGGDSRSARCWPIANRSPRMRDGSCSTGSRSINVVSDSP